MSHLIALDRQNGAISGLCWFKVSRDV